MIIETKSAGKEEKKGNFEFTGALFPNHAHDCVRYLIF
jgi:hypothetical protein